MISLCRNISKRICLAYFFACKLCMQIQNSGNLEGKSQKGGLPSTKAKWHENSFCAAIRYQNLSCNSNLLWERIRKIMCVNQCQLSCGSTSKAFTLPSLYFLLYSTASFPSESCLFPSSVHYSRSDFLGTLKSPDYSRGFELLLQFLCYSPCPAWGRGRYSAALG